MVIRMIHVVRNVSINNTFITPQSMIQSHVERMLLGKGQVFSRLFYPSDLQTTCSNRESDSGQALGAGALLLNHRALF